MAERQLKPAEAVYRCPCLRPFGDRSNRHRHVLRAHPGVSGKNPGGFRSSSTTTSCNSQSSGTSQYVSILCGPAVWQQCRVWWWWRPPACYMQQPGSGWVTVISILFYSRKIIMTCTAKKWGPFVERKERHFPLSRRRRSFNAMYQSFVTMWPYITIFSVCTSCVTYIHQFRWLVSLVHF